MSREGLPQFGWSGFKGMKTAKPPVPYCSVRLKHLGHLGLRIPAEFIGGSMTWDEIGSLVIRWGDNETLIYETPQEGWTYKWDIGLSRFTVTDNTGKATVYNNVKTLSDLGISWDILESPQFSITITGSFENTAFLIAWRYKPGYPTDPDNPLPPEPMPQYNAYIETFSWSEVEKYLNDIFKLAYGRLIDVNKETGAQDATLNAEITGELRKVLVAKIRDLSASGVYPTDLQQGTVNLIGAKKLLIRQAEVFLTTQMLMIRLFASLQNASKPVIEPWMLWELWRWQGQGMVVVSRDRTFDLSPWWG